MTSPTVQQFINAMVRVYGPKAARIKYIRDERAREWCARNHTPDTGPAEPDAPVADLQPYRGRAK